jgi:hypothetical protein
MLCDNCADLGKITTATTTRETENLCRRCAQDHDYRERLKEIEIQRQAREVIAQ